MRQFLANSLFGIAVRARKSPWIETVDTLILGCTHYVRARKSPWIETLVKRDLARLPLSGLVRARGLKLRSRSYAMAGGVRARKSPWIET